MGSGTIFETPKFFGMMTVLGSNPKRETFLFQVGMEKN